MSVTESDIIDGLIQREGGFVVNPDDKGGPTKYGITAATLGNFLGLQRPASKQEVYNLHRDAAATIYKVRYVAQPGFTRENLPFEPLRVQLIDFGVNSGPERAVRWLQRVLRVEVTGKLDEETLRTLHELGTQFLLPLVNDALVAARLYMVDRWTDADPTQKQFEEGVESRALSFFLAVP